MYGRKHSSNGQPSITSEHFEGIVLGLPLGSVVANIVALTVGVGVGPTDGTIVGTGVGLQLILSCGSRHSSGQQLQEIPG